MIGCVEMTELQIDEQSTHTANVKKKNSPKGDIHLCVSVYSKTVGYHSEALWYHSYPNKYSALLKAELIPCQVVSYNCRSNSTDSTLCQK